MSYHVTRKCGNTLKTHNQEKQPKVVGCLTSTGWLSGKVSIMETERCSWPPIVRKEGRVDLWTKTKKISGREARCVTL